MWLDLVDETGGSCFVVFFPAVEELDDEDFQNAVHSVLKFTNPSGLTSIWSLCMLALDSKRPLGRWFMHSELVRLKEWLPGCDVSRIINLGMYQRFRLLLRRFSTGRPSTRLPSLN